MNRREKKKLRLKYLKKIDNALKLEKGKKSKNPNLDHIKLLEKLKSFIQQLDYLIYYDLNQKRVFPCSLSYQDGDVKTWMWVYSLPNQMDRFFDDELIQRDIAFKQLGI